MNRVDRAVSLFQEGFSCSQALVAAFADCFCLDRDVALRIASGFGGGMGRMGKTCGAVTGAVVLIGLKHGSSDAKDKQAKAKTYEVVREFARRFAESHGSLSCRELLGCDISTPEGAQAAKEKRLNVTICLNVVKNAAQILEYMI